MANLYWCPAIVYGGVRFYIPPHLTITDSVSQTVNTLSVPFVDQCLITEVFNNQPVQISLKGYGIPNSCSTRAILDWIEEIREELTGKTFALYLFSDRGYAKCAVEKIEVNIPISKLSAVEISIDIISEAGSTSELEELTFAGGYNNSYPFASQVGRPSGSGSSGGSIIKRVPEMQTLNGTFVGVLASEEIEQHVITVGGLTSSQWRIESLQIISSDNQLAEDSTSIVASKAPIGGTGSGVTCTVGASEKTSNPVTSSITVNSGEKIYIYCTSAGSHNNLQYQINLRAV